MSQTLPRSDRGCRNMNGRLKLGSPKKPVSVWDWVLVPRPNDLCGPYLPLGDARSDSKMRSTWD